MDLSYEYPNFQFCTYFSVEFRYTDKLYLGMQLMQIHLIIQSHCKEQD